jgi:hypothetical protein
MSGDENERINKIEGIKQLINEEKDWGGLVNQIVTIESLEDFNAIDDSIELSEDDFAIIPAGKPQRTKVAAIALIADLKIKLIIEDIEMNRIADLSILRELIGRSFKRRWTLQLASEQLKERIKQICSEGEDVEKVLLKAQLLQLAGDVSFMLTTKVMKEL